MNGQATVVGIAVGLLAVIAGCAAQNEVIGEGPASLAFENDGSETIDVDVRWEDDTGQEQHRAFELFGQGRVELRLADQARYRIILDAECDADCASGVEESGQPVGEPSRAGTDPSDAAP